MSSGAGQIHMSKIIMKKISPSLWFDNQAEEAVNFYTSIFKNSKIIDVAHYGEAGAKVSGQPKGTIMTVIFELEGQQFMALNGGPVFKFSPAISFLVNCKTQEEVISCGRSSPRMEKKNSAAG